MVNMNGRTMYVSERGVRGVVSTETRLHFSQRNYRVAAHYGGGDVIRGWLVGEWVGEQIRFRYAQRERATATIHGGRSICQVEELAGSRIRIIEHFTWDTREGSGVNIFDEVDASSGAR
jgi:hypothetical protein